MSEEGFLHRWSRRKNAERRGEKVEEIAPSSLEAPNSNPEPVAANLQRGTSNLEPAAPAPTPAPPLPAVESLTPESDFAPFMQPDVDPLLKRQALKTLFTDPRFNVMDGLDVYIDDFSKPDPLPEGWLEQLNQVARLGEYRNPEENDPKPEEEAPAEEPLPQAPAPQIASKNEPLASPACDASQASGEPPAEAFISPVPPTRT